MKQHFEYLPEDYEMPPLAEQLVDKEGMSYAQAREIADPSPNQHPVPKDQPRLLHRTGNVRDYTSDSGSDPYWNGTVQPTEMEKQNTAPPMSRGRMLAREMGAAIAAGDHETRQKLLEILSAAPEQDDKTDDNRVA